MEEAGMIHGASTIGKASSELGPAGLLDNRQDVRPKGFGLTPKGREVAEFLPKP